MKNLVLHAHGSGPNPYKVAILLEALGLPYDVKLWEFGDASNGVKSDAFLALNPNGRVPVLEDPSTGVTSWESGAVINYILRVYDREHKYGPGQSEQDKVEFDKWTFFNVSTLGPMQGQANWYIHYNPTENADARKRYVDWTYRCWKVLEDQLAKTGGQSLLETGYSAVDMHCYPWLHNHEYAGLPTDGYPNIQKYLKVMESKPELKAAYEKIPNGQKV